VNLRQKTYLQLLPLTLVLGALYLTSLVFFDRMEEFQSRFALLRNRVSVVQTFIESEQPLSLEKLGEYLDEHLSRITLDLPEFRVEIRRKNAADILYAREVGLFPSGELRSEAQMPPNPQSEMQGVVSRYRHVEQVRSLQLHTISEPLDLVVITQHPLWVFLEASFWKGIFVAFILLAFVGAILAEIIIFITKRGLLSLQQKTESLMSDLGAPISGGEISRIQEINELSNSILTLKDSYDAKLAERNLMESNIPPVFTTGEALSQVRMDSHATTVLTVGNFHFNLVGFWGETPAKVAFLYARDCKVFAFSGLLASAAHPFHPGYLEWIILDVIQQSVAVSNPTIHVLAEAIASLNLMPHWTLAIIDIESGCGEQLSSLGSEMRIEPFCLNNSVRQVIPLGFHFEPPLKVESWNSGNWKTNLMYLLEGYPEGVVICVETVNS